jgi:hypothetical protein
MEKPKSNFPLAQGLFDPCEPFFPLLSGFKGAKQSEQIIHARIPELRLRASWQSLAVSQNLVIVSRCEQKETAVLAKGDSL